MKINLKYKFILCFASVVLLVAILGGIGIGTALRIQKTVAKLTQDTAPSLQNLEAIRSLTHNIQSNLSYLITSTSTKPLDNGDTTLSYQRARLSLQDTVTSYLEITKHSPERFPLAQELGELSQAFLIAADRIIENATTNQSGAIRNLHTQAVRLVGATDLASELELLTLKEHENITNRTIRAALWNYSLAVVAVLLVAASFAITMAIRLAKPIIELNQAAYMLSRGQLGYQVAVTGNDELGDLARAFNKMSSHLKETTVSQEYLHNVLESMSELLIITDTDYQIKKVNNAAITITGFTSEQLVGEKIDLVLPMEAKTLCSKFNPKNNETEIIKNRQILCKRYSGDPFPALLSLAPLITNMLTVGYIFALRDITDQLEKTRELEIVKQRLDYAERMATLGTIGSILVHKLNQPLTAIRLFLQQSLRTLQEERVNNPLLQENLQECLNEATHISSVVKGIAQPATKAFGHMNTFDLASTISRVISILSPESERSSVSIETTGLAEQCTYRGMQIELEELFYIILKNSIQAFKSAGGKVCLNLLKDNGGYTITIEDNGPGVASEHLDRIFEIYFSTKGQNGCGLGLCIARQIIKNHQGELELTSNVGQGTTIKLTLPFSPEQRHE